MILDDYTARLRALPHPDDVGLDVFLQAHDERSALVDAAIAEVERLTPLVEQAPRGLARAAPPPRRRLHELAAVAQAAGVRVAIELHPLPSPHPEISPCG